MELLNLEKPLLHIFVCINDRTHLPDPKKPDCGPKINMEDLINLKREIKKKELKSKFKITQTKCLGICSSKGPVILLQPMQEYYIIQSIQDIRNLIQEKTSIKL